MLVTMKIKIWLHAFAFASCAATKVLSKNEDLPGIQQKLHWSQENRYEKGSLDAEATNGDNFPIWKNRAGNILNNPTLSSSS